MADLKAETLCHKMGDVKAKALIYQLADTLTQCNPLVHVETDAMVVKLAATLSKEVMQILCNETLLRIARQFGQLLKDLKS